MKKAILVALALAFVALLVVGMRMLFGGPAPDRVERTTEWAPGDGMRVAYSTDNVQLFAKRHVWVGLGRAGDSEGAPCCGGVGQEDENESLTADVTHWVIAQTTIDMKMVGVVHVTCDGTQLHKDGDGCRITSVEPVSPPRDCDMGSP